MPRETIQLPVTLPSDSRKRGVCRKCLESRLTGRPGVFSAKVILQESVALTIGQAAAKALEAGAPSSDPDTDSLTVNTAEELDRTYPALLDLDYDSDLISLGQINGYLRQAGGCLNQSIAHLVLPVSGIVSPRQEHTLQEMINRLPGVRATVSYASQTIRLEFDRRKCALPEIVRTLEELGIELRKPEEARPVSAAASAAPAAPEKGFAPLEWIKLVFTHTELLMAFLAGLFLIAGAVVHWTEGPEQLRITLLLVSYVCGGFFPAQEMVKTLARFKLDIDLLMFAAAFGAAALGHYEEGAMLLFLFSLGGAGEELAMSRARNAIAALTKLSPKTALLSLADGNHQEVPVEDLKIHDLVYVPPGQLIPADGQVVSGRSAVDQASITGESVPVEKDPGAAVFAGTVNGNGSLVIEVRKLASDNTLAKVIRMVQEAQTTKSPTQLFTDKVEAVYVPIVIVATALVMVVPPLLALAVPSWAATLQPVRDPGLWKGWFYQAMAFLTAASPCALAIGTPAAILSGIGRSARGGVLVKGGVHLENLGRINAIAFDKTGTLTHGRPQVTEMITLEAGLTEARLLSLATAVERGSQHPLAQAIVNEAAARGINPPVAQGVMQTPGVGIRGIVEQREIIISRPTAVSDSLHGAAAARARAEELENKGRTVVVVADGTQVLGLIALADQPREHVKEMIQQLKNMGVQHIIMLTGDNSRTAAAIAQTIGVDEYLGDLMPEDKLTRIKELDKKYGKVAMVGDGVNDAPALASATVGIAIGGGGSDVALETADIALLSSDLRKLPEAVGISRFSRTIIKQNLFIALGVIAIVSPLAALGWTNIALAVLLHEGSTVVVVLNSLRILRYRP